MFEEYSPFLAIEKDNEVSLMLKEAVYCLSDDKKAVVALLVAGFRQHEIASILEVSRTTVWSKKKDALEQLKKYLEGSILCQDMSSTNV